MTPKDELSRSFRRLGTTPLRSLLDSLDRGELDDVELAAAVDGAPAEELRRFLLELARSYRERTAMLELAAVTASELGLAPLIEKILERTAHLLQADRASLFLVDRARRELWSPHAHGLEPTELRFPMDRGIAGQVVTSGEALNLADAYEHPAFNPEVDRRTGYRTKTLLAAPIRNKRNEVIGVVQAINRRRGRFSEVDEGMLGHLSGILAMALENSMLYEEVVTRQQEIATLLDIGNALSRTLDLGGLIHIIMEKAAEITQAERSTLFLIDRERGELWSKVAHGLDTKELRVPMDRGIAGHVATTGETLNIRDAYSHPLFNPEVDRRTGYHTRNLLCLPIRNVAGEVIGVTQIINKTKGSFTADDERLLTAFAAQAAIAIDNAQLYERVRGIKAYLESILQSISSGVVAVDPAGRIGAANASALRVLRLRADAVVGRQLGESLGDGNAALAAAVAQVQESGKAFLAFDVDLEGGDGRRVTANLNVVPLLDTGGHAQGVVVALEDVTREKRIRSSLTRYMSKDLADQLLRGDAELALGGVRQEATILFSDIRSYTSLTEKLDANEIVAMLNEYFTLMVDVVFQYDGLVDKFIGDAIMAIFGAPFARPDLDPGHAVRAALGMQAALATFNQARARRGRPRIATGVGISTGDVVCGNIGSEKRMDYTAIGDGVNLASRLESATKQYGASILISESTRARLGDGFVLRELDVIRVKGKEVPVRIYEVIAPADRLLPPSTRELLERHEQALALYRQGRFAEALASFESATDRFPGDVVLELYAGRSRAFVEEPPEGEWSGVWDLHSK